MEEKSKDFGEYLNIVKRRKAQIFIPLGILLFIAVAVAYLWPPLYRSTATILIEEQEIPLDLVRSTVTSYADQRIQIIKHQIMTRSNLTKIIDQYGLYAKLRQKKTTEEVLKTMTDNISVDVISAEVVDKRTGQMTNATIAFTLSYKGESPEVTQKVATELTSLFLAQNLKTRERNTQETTSFLKVESENLSHRIAELEKKITALKERADGALPELIQANMQLMNQADQEIRNTDQELRSLKERKISLEGQLASIKPNTPMMGADGERVLGPSEQLKTLRTQFISKSSFLTADHPDLIKMKKEIEALEKETGETQEAAEIYKKLTGEKAHLATLSDRLGVSHPDVVRSRKMIASLEKELAEVKKPETDLSAVKPENPAYINIQTQLESTDHSLESLKVTRDELKKRSETYAEKIKMTPMVEQEYYDLIRDRDNSVQKYNEIRSKLLEARVSEGLEIQHKGERFSLIDPPSLPEKPEAPNRPVILLLGIILAAAGGVGCGALAESVDHSIRTPDALNRMTKVPPLAMIPFIPNQADHHQGRRQKRLLIFVTVTIIFLLPVMIHFLFYPLDVLWFVFIRKMGGG
ncbi:MAG: GumC family protein [Nitrospiria bacterium]